MTFVRLENNKSYQLFHRLALVASRMINLSKLSDLCTNDGEAWQASEHLRLITSIGDQNNKMHSKIICRSLSIGPWFQAIMLLQRQVGSVI